MSSKTTDNKLVGSVNETIHTHYPGLDGLRSIAVIMVFFQHYGAGKIFLFGWGWTGVDIFFVLSGFLITGILYDSQHEPDRYLNFYMRRTLRIFPLYYLLWFALIILTPLVHWQWDWRWATWPAYIGNYSGFYLVHNAENVYEFTRITFGDSINNFFGYPMHLYIGHFWSLCVEEQFYLIWPLLVYQIGNRKILIRICLIIIIIMPLIRWLIVLTASPRLLELELLYRSMPTRIDALLFGGLIALLLRSPYKEILFKSVRVLIWGGLFCLIATYLIMTNIFKIKYIGSSTNWVSVLGFSYIDIFAGGLLLETIKINSILKKILSVKWLRDFGVITYGFYIYHDLFHDFYSYLANRFFSGNAYLFTLLIAFFGTWLIAWLSYRFFESPILKLKSRFSKQIHKAPAL